MGAIEGLESGIERVEQIAPQGEEMRWTTMLLRDLSKASVMTFLLFLFVITFVVQGFKVYGSCMEPNLATGQRVLGNKFVYRFDRPSRGDVIVFRYPKDPSRIYIKRVVGLPGETIGIRGGEVYIDGKRLTETYVRHIPHGTYPSTRIGADSLFVMGDFRDASNDSRYWGELPMQNVQAKIWLRYWPVDKMHIVR